MVELQGEKIEFNLREKLQREWIESADRPMELLLANIVAPILESIPLLVEKTKQRQEEERQRQIALRRRAETKTRELRCC